jgi:metallo-beta-lactamase family protein
MQIQFLGAAGEVTGSKYLINTELEDSACKFMVDYGMFQGAREADEKNQKPLAFNPEEIYFLLLTHAHIDHCGLIPRLCAEGFNGPIYCTSTTAKLIEIMLLDSAHIQVSDFERAERKNKLGKWRGDMPVLLYDTKQAIESLNQVKPIPYSKKFSPIKDIHVTFEEAGHIIGSSIAVIDVKEKDKDLKRLVFSGDLGMFEKPIFRQPALIESADVLVVESTYGDRLHRGLKETEDELVEILTKTLNRGGNVIIPAFAVGRTQEILFILADLIRRDRLPHLNVWVDSPMATKVTELTRDCIDELDDDAKLLYQWLLDHKNKIDVRFVGDVEESKALNRLKSGAIIISSSGMCQAGRILHHLINNLPFEKNAIVITGFQALRTLGRRLVDEAASVKIMGEYIDVKASIHTLGGLSAHADRDNLLKWLKGFKQKPKYVFVAHGEPSASVHFVQSIRETLNWNDVIIPTLQSTFDVG